MAADRTLPLWSRDETILALWTASSAARECLATDPMILALSAFLREAQPGASMIDRRFRNPHGAARKVHLFRELIDRRRIGARCPMETAVWQEFGSDLGGLYEAAMLARARLAELPVGINQPSRGPVPSDFRASSEIADDKGEVYLAKLDGFVTATGHIFVKVGRTRDVPHREADLNFAFPTGLGIRWRMIAHWRLADAWAAHRAEQTILQTKAAENLSAGGEFLLLRGNEVAQLVDDCHIIVTTVLSSESPTSVRKAHDRRVKATRTRRPYSRASGALTGRERLKGRSGRG